MVATVVFGFIIIPIYIKSRKVKKVDIPKIQEDKYIEIKQFDNNNYLVSVFENVFNSIKNDNNWEVKFDTSYSSNEIKFEKKVKSVKNSFIESKVILSVKYELKEGLFKIGNIFISAGSTMYYTGNLSNDNYSFFYNCYVDYQTKINDVLKNRADETLQVINDVIGLSSTRDFKIDQILK
jgi:hypothetical protein